jgi:hypothetical protein
MRILFFSTLYILFTLFASAQERFNTDFKIEINKQIKYKKYIHYIKCDSSGNAIYKCQGPVTYFKGNKKISIIENNFYFRKYFYFENKTLQGFCSINYGTNPIICIYYYDTLNRIIAKKSYVKMIKYDLQNTIKFLANINIRNIKDFKELEILTYKYNSNNLNQVINVSNKFDTLSIIKYEYEKQLLKKINYKAKFGKQINVDIFWNEEDNVFPNYCIVSKNNQNKIKLIFSKKDSKTYLVQVYNINPTYPYKISQTKITFDKNKNDFTSASNNCIYWKDNFFNFIQFCSEPSFIENEL